MKLPRDLSGQELAALLRPYGYRITRQTGSHVRLTSTIQGFDHHLTIPAHKALKPGTLSSILTDVADYLKLGRGKLMRNLFGSRH